ncbi:MAG: T9SS type A sorting domain-containing protein [Flavobacteriales bacterium]
MKLLKVTLSLCTAALLHTGAWAAVPTPDFELTNLSSSPYTFNGQTAECDAWFFYGNGHSSLVNPIIILKGFDLTNSEGKDELWNTMNQKGLAADLRQMGYDIVLVSYDNSMDDMEKNAMSAVKIIDYVNSMTPPTSRNVVMGISMGGLIARYSLMYMENLNIDHRTKLYISFDTPHQGANLPIGDQAFIDYFQGNGIYADALKSQAAKQLLIYNYYSNTIPSTERNAFNQKLIAMGDYPSAVGLRKIAISNGSGAGYERSGQKDVEPSGNLLNPGDKMIDYQYYDWAVDINGFSYAISNKGIGVRRVFYGMIDKFGPDYNDYELSVDWTPVDHVPGGYFPTNKMIADIKTGHGPIYSLFDNHCFVPTTSALDLRNIDDDYYFSVSFAKDNGSIWSKTPFDDIFVYDSEENHYHEEISLEIESFIKNQISVEDCDLTIPNTTLSGQFKRYTAGKSITVAGEPDRKFIAKNSSSVRLKAGEKITFGTGFKISGESYLSAQIDPSLSCPSSTKTTLTPYLVGAPVPINSAITTISNQTPETTNLVGEIDLNIIRTYPNPTSGIMHIEISSGVDQKVHIGIYDILGNEVMTVADEILTHKTYDADLSTLENGLYFVKATYNNSSIESNKISLIK